MASPYQLSNLDLSILNTAGQSFSLYLAFLNPVAFTTNWVDLGQDKSGNWLPPPNTDTAALRIAPYAPVANLGSNRIAFVGEPLYFDGSRSCQRFDLPVVSYQWGVNSGNVTSALYANGSQAAFTFTSPGIYQVTLTVTDRAGTAVSGTRQVMVYQDRAHALPGMISISGPSGSLENGGGWQCQLTTVNSQFTLYPPDMLPIGTYQPLVIMAETSFEVAPGVWVNRTMGVMGQFNPGAPYSDPRILFDGYIQAGTVHQDVDKDTLSFTCVGPQMILQEAKAHELGYYNCAYTSLANWVPQGCVPSPMGQGFMVGGLMTNDVIHSILSYHSNVAQYHDIHVWNSCIPTQPYNVSAGTYAAYNLVYSTLSLTEGTIWQNLSDLVSNEWSQLYCERDGSIRVGPQVNYRGQDFWQTPTLLGPTTASVFVNFVQDLGYTVGDALSSMGQNLPPALPAFPMPVTFVHPWGQAPLPSSYFRPFQGFPDPAVSAVQTVLIGPPLLCVFADNATYDQGLLPTVSGAVFPWTASNWPQDLTIYPTMMEFSEIYSGRTSLVKLIGNLANGGTTQWVSWYPQNTFQVTGNGSGNLVTTVLPAGNWVVDEGHVLPDVTTSQNKTLMSNWWWEIARREWYAQNIHYTGIVTLGLFTPISLGDIVATSRQNASLNPKWSLKPFYVTDVSFNIDLSSHTWSTTLSLNEVTSVLLGAVQPPPAILPTG